MVAALAAVVACRQLVGIGDAPPAGAVADSGADAAPATCRIAYAGDSCQACVDARCGAQSTACCGSPPCNALESCLGACRGDATCRAQCVQDHRNGDDPTLPAFDACVVGSCSTECQIACGGVPQFATPAAAAACLQCFESNGGCTAATQCLSDPTCAAFVNCLATAATPQLSDACGDGGSAPSAFIASIATCTQACAVDRNWSYLGHVAWPPGTSDDLTIELTVQDGVHPGQLPPGVVTAKLCNRSDPDCTTPVTTGTTDPATGIVDLVQHRDASAGILSNGYVDLSTPDAGADAGIVPELFYWSYPLSQSPAPLTAFVATPFEEQQVAINSHFQQDPSLGLVHVQLLDCLFQSAAEVTLTVSPSGTATQVCTTTGVGFACADAGIASRGSAIINVPVGDVQVAAWAPGVSIPIGTYTVHVRAGSEVQLTALPKPQ